MWLLPMPIMYIFMMTNKRELKKRRMLSDFAGIIRNLTYHSTVVTGVGQVDDAPRGGALVVLLHYGTQELSLPEPAGRIVIVEILRIL